MTRTPLLTIDDLTAGTLVHTPAASGECPSGGPGHAGPNGPQRASLLLALASTLAGGGRHVEAFGGQSKAGPSDT